MPLGGSRRSLLSHLRGLFITRPREARTARPDFWGSPWWWNGRPAALRSDSTRGESRGGGQGGVSIPIRLTVNSQTAPWHRILQNLAASHFSPTPPGGEDHQFSSGNTSMVSLEAKARQLQPFHLLQLHFNGIYDHSISSFIRDHNVAMTDTSSRIFLLEWNSELNFFFAHLTHYWQDQSVSSEGKETVATALLQFCASAET